MLTRGPNYIMIRRAIFGKVHGHGVKEICGSPLACLSKVTHQLLFDPLESEFMSVI